MPNGALWNRQITTINKLHIYNSILENNVTHGDEMWKFNRNLESNLTLMKMRSARCSRLQTKTRNNVIRGKKKTFVIRF